jgi:hypothetical protein
MTKRDLIQLRDSTNEPAVKAALRYAIVRIEVLEERLREVHLLCKSIQRTASYKEDEA